MGKLIVLEGIDGSGKSSQYRRVCQRLEEDGISFTHIVFPRYDRESSALLRLYLNGAFGSAPEDVNAYTASTFFAVDRFASFRDDWGKAYAAGELILSDRYTTSNMVHQGSKLSDEELPEFFSWLSDLEFNRMGLPKPDLVIYLDTTIEISLRRMRWMTAFPVSYGGNIRKRTAAGYWGSPWKSITVLSTDIISDGSRRTWNSVSTVWEGSENDQNN